MKSQQKRRHPNRTQQVALKAAELTEVVNAAGRKSSKRNGFDPNDRDYRGLSKKIRGIPSEQFDRLLHDDEE